MVVLELELIKFRNYFHVKTEFSPRLNLVYGENGQGKTNLVEAIYYLCNLDSFRTRKIPHLLNDPQETACLNAKIKRNTVLHTIKVRISKKGKQVVLDDSSFRKTSEYILSFFALSFTPEDVNLFRGAPSERRRFIDRTLSFIDPSYFSDLREYSQILSQKNVLLKKKNAAQLGVWNELQAKYGTKVVSKRQAFVDKLNGFLSQVFYKTTGRNEALKLVYESSCRNSDEAQFLSILKNVINRELEYGYSVHGPHRDDFRLFLDAKGDRDFFSQGEFRVTNLSLKMAINQIILETHQFCPILIFDDLFSELDSNVNQRVMAYFLELPNQIFITSTVPLFMGQNSGEKIINVTEGILNYSAKN